MGIYVRSCLVRELISQAEKGIFRAKPFGNIIRESALPLDRKTEFEEIIDSINRYKKQSRYFTHQVIGSLFLEIISCRGMIDVIPKKNMMTPNDFLIKTSDESKKEVIISEQIRAAGKWINDIKVALDKYVNLNDEEKQICIKYMLSFLGKDGNAGDSEYGLISFLLNEGFL